jgi:multidrug efflux pump subunit AcrB
MKAATTVGAWFVEPFNRASPGPPRASSRRRAPAAHPLLRSSLSSVIALMRGLFLRMPSSFVPAEDQGYIFGNIQLPDGATLERTRKLTELVSDIAQNTPGCRP